MYNYISIRLTNVLSYVSKSRAHFHEGLPTGGRLRRCRMLVAVGHRWKRGVSTGSQLLPHVGRHLKASTLLNLFLRSL